MNRLHWPNEHPWLILQNSMWKLLCSCKTKHYWKTLINSSHALWINQRHSKWQQNWGIKEKRRKENKRAAEKQILNLNICKLRKGRRLRIQFQWKIPKDKVLRPSKIKRSYKRKKEILSWKRNPSSSRTKELPPSNLLKHSPKENNKLRSR